MDGVQSCPNADRPEVVKGSTFLLLHICDHTAHNDSRAIRTQIVPLGSCAAETMHR